jgi:hypothetical protein
MNNDNNEVSESGAPIYRYKSNDSQWIPPNMEDSYMEAITAHIEKHIGPVKTVWHEILSTIVHIDVHQIEPTAERPYWTLVTTGMSDLPMSAPPQYHDWAYAELMICLPKEWKMTETDFKDERYYWPVRCLKYLALFPHQYKTWLSWGHTIPTGDPAMPIHDSVPFNCLMLGCPVTVSTDFWTLPVRDDKKIHFFSVIPLYPGEMELKLKKGAEELAKRFARHKISEIVNPMRRDVSKTKWWKLW